MGGGYDGHGYHIDIGGGFIYPIRPTIKLAPFVAYTPISQWTRRKQVGYILIDPIIGPEPAYEGRTCQHSGLRVGFSILFNLFASISYTSSVSPSNTIGETTLALAKLRFAKRNESKESSRRVPCPRHPAR